MNDVQRSGQSIRLEAKMTLKLTVPDMACQACVGSITKAVTALDPAAQIDADPKTKQVTIETQADATAVKAAITAAGYTVA